MYQMILASNSPRRKELLSQAGITFQVIPAVGEEIAHTEIPSELVKELSYQKAAEVAAAVDQQAVILGSDTVVAIDNQILGKPKSEADAYEMLKKISGKQHQVFTGVTLLVKDSNGIVATKTFVECANVFVAALSEEEIHSYIATKEPMDKAGAYGIQGGFAKYVVRIEGDYYTIVGLPIAKVYESLKELNVLDQLC